MGNFYIWVQGNCIYWALVHVSGQVWRGGLQWMGLDEDIPIGKVLPFRNVPISPGFCLLLGMVFYALKNVYQ